MQRIFKNKGNSDFVKDIVDLLNKVGKEGEEAKISLKDVIHVRDHLILTITFINALRVSNIINVTLKEVEAAKKHDEFDAFAFKKNKYKTSLIFGEKIVLIPTLTYHHIKLYLKYLRPLILLDSHRVLRNRYLFVGSKQGPQKQAVQMSYSLILNRLLKCFEKGVALGEDSLDSMAHCYGKHVEVCKKHYVQFYSNRMAAEHSWKSYKCCRTLTKEEEKVANKRIELLAKKNYQNSGRS